MLNNEWRNLERFPYANGDWQLLRPPMNRKHSGQFRVIRSIKNWHIYDPLVVATPGSTRFLPPICIQQFSNSMFHDLRKKLNAIIIMIFFGLIFFLLELIYLGLPVFDNKMLHVIIFLITCLLIDKYVIFNNINSLIERSLFFHWIFSTKNISVKIFSTMMLASGVLQIYYTSKIGSLEQLVINYGAYFPAIKTGEVWRYLTGPFFHINFFHWVLNFTMGIITIKLSSAIFNKITIGEFFLFLIFSTVAAEYLTFPTPVDGFVGVSGGVFGLLGWLVSYSARNSDAFPQRFWLSLLCFSSLNLLASSTSSENSSHVAHLTGFMLGLALGLRQPNN